MNTLGDLNAYLFEQLERLNEINPCSQEAKDEIERSKAMSGIAKDIVRNADLVLQAKRLIDDRMDADLKMPKMLEG